jgi:hypothetical protein
LPKEGEKGIYRLQHKGFALWIKLYADPDFYKSILYEAAKKNQDTKEETPTNKSSKR